MFYSNLFKCVAILAMILGLTSCGNGTPKTKEVVLEDRVKISAQSPDFSITEVTEDGETMGIMRCRVLVEVLQDLYWRADLKMILYDEDGAELIYLKSDDLPKKKGDKKWIDFGLTWGNSGRSKLELEKILKQTKSIQFVGEYLKEED